MGLPNRDEMEGKVDKAKGKVKETMGRALDDPELRDEGKAEHAKGHVKEGVGKARRKVGETMKDIGDEIAR